MRKLILDLYLNLQLLIWFGVCVFLSILVLAMLIHGNLLNHIWWLSFKTLFFQLCALQNRIKNYGKLIPMNIYDWNLVSIFLCDLIKKYMLINSFCTDIFEDYATPVPAAQSLLHSCCKKRKGILPKAMQIIMQVMIQWQILEIN